MTLHGLVKTAGIIQVSEEIMADYWPEFIPSHHLRAQLAQLELERQQAGAVQYQRQRRHPRLGERSGVEARTRLQALAAHPIAGGMAEADLLRVGHHDLDRAHRCARASEPVEVGGELFYLRLTVGH